MITRAPTGSAASRAALVLLTVLLSATALVGCSSSAQISSLGQTGSDAAAQTQTAALTMRLDGSRRAPFTVSSTAINDVVKHLAQDEASVAQTDATGGAGADRDSLLRLIRTAEDEVLRAQAIEPGASSLDYLTATKRLTAQAKALVKLSDRLRGSS